MKPLISVIVPVYKVEKYLARCLNSLINQSYTNCEFIVVDDGSPDNCPQICDKFAEVDVRINVIHKENGGVSDARNRGIAESKGDYITFVDSDDYVTEDYVEYLWGLLKKYNADVSVGGRYVINKNETIRTASILKEPTQDVVLNSHDAVKEICYGRIGTVAWGKLYKRNIVEACPFPVGRIYEDLGTVCKYMGESEKIVIGTKKVYYYWEHDASIFHSSVTERKLMDGRYICNQLYEYIENNYPDLKRAADCRCVRKYLEYMPNVVREKDRKNIKYITSVVRPHLLGIIANKEVAGIFKLATLATACGGSVSLFLWSMAIKRKGL